MTNSNPFYTVLQITLNQEISLSKVLPKKLYNLHLLICSLLALDRNRTLYIKAMKKLII